MLTFLMLFCSVIAETLIHTNAQGSNSDVLTTDSVAYMTGVKNKQEIADSINLMKSAFAALKSMRLIEKVETQLLYRHIKGTVYHAVESQCDNTPFLTADMSFIDTSRVNDLRWVALSRDLLNRKYTDPWGKKHTWRGKIKLGDTIWIDYDNKNIWKTTHSPFKHVSRRGDSIMVARQNVRYEKMKAKYEQIKGYWIVHDVMGTQYTLQNRKGKYILDKNGNKQVIQIYSAIDFLQHPELGMMDVWDRNITISKRKVKYITLDQVSFASN